MSTPRERPKRVSLADVARIAGVSSNTVSRVVRGDTEVAEETRQRISAIVEEVGYRPNYAARALARNRTGVVHVMLAAPMFHGHGQTLLAVVNEASKAGYNVSVSNAYTRDGKLERRGNIFHVDGVIILGGQDPTVDIALDIAQSHPTVLLLSNEIHLDGVSTVSVDNVRGSYLATKHLLDTGITDLLHCEGAAGWNDAARRREGYEQACAEYGVDPRIVGCSSWNAQAGYDALSSEKTTIPQGIVAANDQIALGVIRALHEQGKNIPHDVKVVGFDDDDGADCFLPPLSTIRQRFDLVGRAAVSQMENLIADGTTEDVLIAPELVIRSSSIN
ncbi:MAG: LacI family transcriptional regulator [Actinobacteria bacterium]|nr:MAG: LacI family transcriptional regulator [Actinomycetota bacterium]